MSVTYSLEKVFLLAEHMETSGGSFYRQAAEAAANEESRQFFLTLAQQEDSHRRTFARLRAQAADAPGGVEHVTDDEAVIRYLQAVAGEFMFDEAQSAEDILTGDETMEDILWMAVKREKDSIVLYLGIVDALGEESDKRIVQKMLSEEQSHLAELMFQLENVPAAES